jgi:indolepyruvate ferredoxin oxidoreductase beta subunit
VISGVGGQGVLFVTRLLAEAAILQGRPVFTTETHGMAQRGGTVLSHLKVGDFASPMIRPRQADGLLVFKDENRALHGFYLHPGAWTITNCTTTPSLETSGPTAAIDADRLAQQIQNPRAVNLILLGFALARAQQEAWPHFRLFCSLQQVQAAIKLRLAGKPAMQTAAMEALQTGFEGGVQAAVEGG